MPEIVAQLVQGLNALPVGEQSPNDQLLLLALWDQILRTLPQSQPQLHEVLAQLLRIQNQNWNLEILTKHAAGKWIKLFDGESTNLLNRLKRQTLLRISSAHFATTGLHRRTKDAPQAFDPKLHWGTTQNHNLQMFILRSLKEMFLADDQQLANVLTPLRALEKTLLQAGIIDEAFLDEFKTIGSPESRCSRPLKVD